MPIDPYAPCPAGCPKKVKFCCPDLLSELEKIGRLLEGDQRLSCLEYLQKTEEKFPGRACLMTTRAMLEDSLGQHQAAEATVVEALKLHPQNPVVLSQSALLVAQKSPESAIELLQRALEASGEVVAQQVVAAIGRVGQLLLMSGSFVAGRGHLMLAGVLDPEHPEPLMLLARLADSDVPILLRDDVDLVPCPAGAPWAKAFNSAMELVDRGKWRQALVTLTALTTVSGQAPSVWRNIAVLRSWLGDRAGAQEAWRKLASVSGNEDEAIEAEAMALLSEPAKEALTSELVSIEIPIRDIEPLTERLVADRRAASEPVDTAAESHGDTPPPRALYSLLDRPLPTSGESLALADVPEVLGRAAVYGRETDRPARVELMGVRGSELTRALELLREIAGDALDAEQKEQSEQISGPVPQQLRSAIRLPRDTPAEVAQRIVREKAHHFRMEKWPSTPHPGLQGKTPREAAADPLLRRRVQALILLQELVHQQRRDEADYNLVRESLGLPQATRIDPSGLELESISLTRLGRLEPAKLGDNDLLTAYVRAVQGNVLSAISALGQEVLRRPSLEGKFDKVELFAELAKASLDSSTAVGFLDRARQAADALRRSTATIDLLELAIHIDNLDVPEINRVLKQIMTKHGREPGVQQRVMEMLWSAGLIHPSQMAPGGAEAAAPGLAGAGSAPAAAAEPGIWTPDSERPAGGSKSGLWVPGMD